MSPILFPPEPAYDGQEVSAASPTPAADLQRILDAGLPAIMPRTRPGSPLAFETYVTVPTGARIYGPTDGYCEIVPAASYAPSAGNADLDEGVFRGASVVGAQIATLQVSARQRSRVLRLDANPAPGVELRVKSITGQSGTAYVGYGADVIGYEVGRVVSTVFVSGANYDVLLDQPLWQNHGSGSTIHAMTLVRDVIITGLYLNFAGKTHAAGVVASGFDGLWLRRCKFAGFSRAQMSFLEGARGIELQECVTELGTNCAVRVLSCEFAVTGFRTKRGGARRHANGITRGLFTVRHASRGVIFDSVLEGASCGISWWGGHATIGQKTIVRDMDPKVRADSDPQLMTPAGAGSPVTASGLDMGNFASPTAWGEYAVGHDVDLMIEDCGGLDTGGNLIYPAAFLCDLLGARFKLRISNTGAHLSEGVAPSRAGYATGTVWYDVTDAHCELSCTGIDGPVRLEGNGNSIRFSRVECFLNDGLSTVGRSFLQVGASGAIGGVSFGDVSLSADDGIPFAQGYSAPTVASMMSISIDRFHYKNLNAEWTKCQFYRQTEAVAVTRGEEMESFATTVSATPCRGARNPSTALTRDKLTAVAGFGVAATATIAQNTWMLGSNGQSRAIRSTTTLAYEDKLTAVAPPSRDIAVSAVADDKGIVDRLVVSGLVQTRR